MRQWMAITMLACFLVGCAGSEATKGIPTPMPQPNQASFPDVATPTAKPEIRSTSTASPTRTLIPMPTATPPLSSFTINEVDQFAYNQMKRLGRGVNLGNALEAPNEGEWGVVLKEEYFKLIKDAGFQSVRVPIRWSTHAGTEAPYTIDPVFFERVDWVVAQAMKNNLAVVINMHHYEEIMVEPEKHEARFLAIWKQIATHYQDQPDVVIFEILNEPNSGLGSTLWNRYASEAIQTIRETNPKRTILVGPASWNGLGSLMELELPENDRNLIVTFHYYSPFEFTHQGAEWASGSDAWLGTPWNGEPYEKDAVKTDFEFAAAWGMTHHRPIYLGEFGAYSKADIDSRHRWTAYIARTAEELGMSWAYWEFCAGFGVYNPDTNAWNVPILNALIPSE